MNDLIKQYNGAKKGRRDSRLVSTPLPFKPKTNEKDFSRGYIVRHFVQKVNDDFWQKALNFRTVLVARSEVCLMFPILSFLQNLN